MNPFEEMKTPLLRLRQVRSLFLNIYPPHQRGGLGSANLHRPESTAKQIDFYS